jgi:hypothetical protein
VQLLSKEIWSIHSDGTRHFRPETMACMTPPRCEREPTSAKTPLGPLEMKDRSEGLVFDTLLPAIRPVDRCCHLSVQSDKRARSSSTFAISSWRRGFPRLGRLTEKQDQISRLCCSLGPRRRRSSEGVPLEFLLAALQGCLIGLNLVEAPANFSRFLSGHAAMFVKFHGVTPS